MMLNGVELIETTLMLTAKCRCGSLVAASLIRGGDEIDADFMMTVAKLHHAGGKVEILDTSETALEFNRCKCNLQKEV